MNAVRTIGAEQLHSIRVVVSKLEFCRSVLLETSGCVLEVSWNISEDILVTKVADPSKIIVETRVIRCQSVVLSTTFRNDHKVEEVTISIVGQLGNRHSFICGTEETQGPVDLTLADAGLACSTEDWLGSGCTISEVRVVADLASRGVVQDATISVPEVDTQRELSTGTNAGEITLVHLILVGVEERQWTRK